MNAYHDFELFAPGMTANTYTVNEHNHWEIRGITATEPVFDDNFDADIAAVGEENTVGFSDDSEDYSGSSDSFETTSDVVAQHHDGQPISTPPTTPDLHPTTIHHAALTSRKANHASIRKGDLKKSTSHLSRGTRAHKKSKDTRLTKTVCHHSADERELKAPHKYTPTEDANGEGPLKRWATTRERHERIAYGIFEYQQRNSSSGSRRKSGSKK